MATLVSSSEEQSVCVLIDSGNEQNRELILFWIERQAWASVQIIERKEIAEERQQKETATTDRILRKRRQKRTDKCTAGRGGGRWRRRLLRVSDFGELNGKKLMKTRQWESEQDRLIDWATDRKTDKLILDKTGQDWTVDCWLIQTGEWWWTHSQPTASNDDLCGTVRADAGENYDR